MSTLVVDVGTSGLRAAVVDGGGAVRGLEYRAFPPSTPFPGLVEFDGAAMAEAVLEVATRSLATSGPVAAVGITNQRASTLVWDRGSGEPIGPGLGWQDLRTVFDCINAKSEHGLPLAPNQSATKVAWLLNNIAGARDRDLCFGTVDSWVAWVLSRGAVHVTDPSNAAVTGLLSADSMSWSAEACSALDVPMGMLPTVIDSTGVFGEATALPGAPPLAALIGDQQASLVGQGCVRPGLAKITFGTGGMLDVCVGPTGPPSARRSENGTFPIVAWSRAGQRMWGAEAIMLSAGTNVEWLRDDLGLIDSAAHSHDVAAQCDHTDGVVYVPALMGLGTPQWDYGARGTLLGLTRGSGRPQLVRAVLEGIAHRGADLLEAAESDYGNSIAAIRVDGGMSQNPTFIQALANATGRAIEVSRETEATTIGAAYLAGLAVGVWGSFDDIAAAWHPRLVVEPTGQLDRQQWARAIERARGWIPDLSALDF
ncbi:MAG TPA: FGGY family carbohydrate kinase [Ilumatobacteraceae bacterium]|nr:FGGY family carbohydrate kinase [Ilumatobacteraceae bacterium]